MHHYMHQRYAPFYTKIPGKKYYIYVYIYKNIKTKMNIIQFSDLMYKFKNIKLIMNLFILYSNLIY
jgi:hypothetical protein